MSSLWRSRIGDERCKAIPKDKIMAFRGYTHPLSNHYPCKIEIFNKTFKSLEHIFFWRMAVEFGKMELAQEICGCRHAGEAKRLGKMIADDDKRWEWEEKNLDFMKVLLDAKAEQCSEFRQCLLVNADKVFAEATPSNFWGTGMSPLDSELTSPEFWPGKNMLGALITELASYLMTKDHENTMPFEDVDDPSRRIKWLIK